MKKVIYHVSDLNISGKGYIRNAVRGIFIKDTKILMIYSPINRDYKFPGGGIETNESHEDALIREFQEECGLYNMKVSAKMGEIIEYDLPLEKEFNYFRMNSYYYICSTFDTEFRDQILDDYESRLKFKPIWIDISDALENNKKLLKSGETLPKWLKRETTFLDYIVNNKDEFIYE